MFTLPSLCQATPLLTSHSILCISLSQHFYIVLNWCFYVFQKMTKVQSVRAHIFHPCLAAFQSLSDVQLFVNPWTAVHQIPLSFTVSWSLLRFISIELVMLSNNHILCHPLLLLPSTFPSIEVFSNKKTSI